jgi:hypothetical protein
MRDLCRWRRRQQAYKYLPANRVRTLPCPNHLAVTGPSTGGTWVTPQEQLVLLAGSEVDRLVVDEDLDRLGSRNSWAFLDAAAATRIPMALTARMNRSASAKAMNRPSGARCRGECDPDRDGADR